jgi:hypothetical protein
MLAQLSRVPALRWRFLSWSCVLTAPAMAQAVTITPVTDYTVTATTAAGAQTASIPAGVPTVNASRVVGDHATVVVGSGWQGVAFHTECSVHGHLHAIVNVPGGTATKAPSDVVFTVQGLGARPVAVAVVRTITLTGTSQLPLFEVDIGDDGTTEVTATQAGPPSHARMLGPQPLRIRIRTGASVTQVGSQLLHYAIRVVPDNGITLALLGGGCGGALVAPQQSFQHEGLEFFGPMTPAILVLGLAGQPQPLPGAASLPCLLVPRPDLLTVVVPFEPFVLDLPPAVRPLIVWGQTVSLQPGGLAASTAWSASAQ